MADRARDEDRAGQRLRGRRKPPLPRHPARRRRGPVPAFVADTHAAAWIVQIGDSRAYRLRAGLLEMLTTDHTIAWLGLLQGWFTPDSPEARAARYRLTRFTRFNQILAEAEIAVHPDQKLTDELVLAIAISPPWLVSYFTLQGRGGG